jgi:leucine dehydrogenase
MDATPIARNGFEHEEVLKLEDSASGLRGFLAIHSTALGPALGGIRIRPYTNEGEALEDALRLSCAMTYKTALAELSAGGGKTVIIQNPGHGGERQRAPMFEALGDIIETLRGRYFAGPDVGVTSADLTAVRKRTRYVADETLPELGNIAEHTAIGVWHALRACMDFAHLRRVRVAIQGAGGVGMSLARILKREGMELAIADLDPARADRAARECGARVRAADEILFADCDLLAPCALGGVIDSAVIPRLRAQIICGSANNLLGAAGDADELHRRGILYAPDYLVNAGGVIRGADFYLLGLRDSEASLARIYGRTKRILEIAHERACSPVRIADGLAEARWRGARRSA